MRALIEVAYRRTSVPSVAIPVKTECLAIILPNTVSTNGV